MGTIAQKLFKLQATKLDIASAIIQKGQSVTQNDTFASYAGKIRAIEPDLTTTTITQNGTYTPPTGTDGFSRVKVNIAIPTNVDTHDTGEPDLNIDTNDDGRPDVNVDTNADGQPDVNIDTDGDGQPNINIDTDGDYKPDINIDTDGDGEADLNIDTDDDGEPDMNIDTNGDGKPDTNIDSDGDGVPDTNLDDDGDGIPDRNIDPNYDRQMRLGTKTITENGTYNAYSDHVFGYSSVTVDVAGGGGTGINDLQYATKLNDVYFSDAYVRNVGDRVIAYEGGKGGSLSRLSNSYPFYGKSAWEVGQYDGYIYYFVTTPYSASENYNYLYRVPIDSLNSPEIVSNTKISISNCKILGSLINFTTYGDFGSTYIGTLDAPFSGLNGPYTINVDSYGRGGGSYFVSRLGYINGFSGRYPTVTLAADRIQFPYNQYSNMIVGTSGSDIYLESSGSFCRYSSSSRTNPSLQETITTNVGYQVSYTTYWDGKLITVDSNGDLGYFTLTSGTFNYILDGDGNKINGTLNNYGKVTSFKYNDNSWDDGFIVSMSGKIVIIIKKSSSSLSGIVYNVNASKYNYFINTNYNYYWNGSYLYKFYAYTAELFWSGTAKNYTKAFLGKGGFGLVLEKNGSVGKIGVLFN